MLYRLLLDLICVVVCVVATATDLRTRTIPNWLTVGGVILGVAANALFFDNGWLSAAIGLLTSGIVFGIFGAVGFVGMGDVKLMAAVGALLGWPIAVWAVAYVGVAGGVLALIYAVARGELSAVLHNLGKITRGLVRKGSEQAAVELHRIPYAAAILVGTGWAICARYLPQLRL